MKSLSKRKTEISKSVLTSIGKVTKKRKSALIKPVAYNFWTVSNWMVCTTGHGLCYLWNWSRHYSNNNCCGNTRENWWALSKSQWFCLKRHFLRLLNTLITAILISFTDVFLWESPRDNSRVADLQVIVNLGLPMFWLMVILNYFVTCSPFVSPFLAGTNRSFS